MLLYGYATGLTLSRRIEKATYDSIPFRYLAADQHPDHDTIAAFRQQHLEALATLFVEALRLCRKAGLVTLANVAIDNAKQPKRRCTFTDPDSRMMMDKGQRHLVYAYNAQAAVDGHAQVIVSAELTQDETDYGMLLPMVAAVEEAMGEKSAAITEDAGYWDTENINSEALKGMLALVNPDGGKKTKRIDEEQERRRSNPTMVRVRELLKTDEAKALYNQRKTIVEPVFGQIKQARGIREFRLRGFERTKAEWKLICLTHNLLKLYRYDWLPRKASKAA